MVTHNPYRARAKDILHLIIKHGPLSFSGIHKMLIPEMKKKRLKESLRILRAKKFLISRVVGETKVFYHLPQQLNLRQNLACYLNCRPEDLIQHSFKHRYWIHTECCEYWIFNLNRLFPKAEVVRERDFYNDSVAQRIMLIDKKDFELRPDFLLVFPKVDSFERISIAVEIERFRKSNRELLRKLDKYANKTMLDGLIYVCDSDSLCETIRLLYKNRTLERAHRIKHYGNNFLLFSDALNTKDQPLKQIFNSAKENVDILNWVSLLRSTKRNFRRDKSFPQPGSPALAESRHL